jgi:flagellar assembly protein FliH
LSKLVKSSQIIIDKKKYILNNDFFIPTPPPPQEEVEAVEEEEEVDLEDYADELRRMKEDMLEAVKIEKDQMLEVANHERESIINDAYAQANQIKESARQEAYDQGYQDGVTSGYGEATGFIDEALSIKQTYQDKFDKIKETSEAEITGVIISTVEKILNKHIQEDYDLITGLVEKALVKCAFTTNLTLRVAPDDYDSALSIKKYILSLTENVEDIEIKQDNALPKGSCVIDTDAGSVDSSIHTQFENVKNKFIELLQSE